MLPGDKSPSQDTIQALIYGTDVYLSTIHASLPVLWLTVYQAAPSEPEASRDRCLGKAVEVALALVQFSISFKLSTYGENSMKVDGKSRS